MADIATTTANNNIQITLVDDNNKTITFPESILSFTTAIKDMRDALGDDGVILRKVTARDMKFFIEFCNLLNKKREKIILTILDELSDPNSTHHGNFPKFIAEMSELFSVDGEEKEKLEKTASENPGCDPEEVERLKKLIKLDEKYDKYLGPANSFIERLLVVLFHDKDIGKFLSVDEETLKKYETQEDIAVAMPEDEVLIRLDPTCEYVGHQLLSEIVNGALYKVAVTSVYKNGLKKFMAANKDTIKAPNRSHADPFASAFKKRFGIPDDMTDEEKDVRFSIDMFQNPMAD